MIRFNQSPRLSSHLLRRYRFNIATLIVVFVSCLKESVDSSLLVSCRIALQSAPISVLFAIYRLRPDLSLLILPNVENATSTLRSWLDSFLDPLSIHISLHSSSDSDWRTRSRGHSTSPSLFAWLDPPRDRPEIFPPPSSYATHQKEGSIDVRVPLFGQQRPSF